MKAKNSFWLVYSLVYIFPCPLLTNTGLFVFFLDLSSLVRDLALDWKVLLST